MADAASTLRTARAALQEGLITEGDYEAVKAAFLKAQQFKAGLDAGFISEADYAEVKTRFLDAFYGLNVADTNGGGGSSGGGGATQQSASPAQGQPTVMAGETRSLPSRPHLNVRPVEHPSRRTEAPQNEGVQHCITRGESRSNA